MNLLLTLSKQYFVESHEDGQIDEKELKRVLKLIYKSYNLIEKFSKNVSPLSTRECLQQV